MANEQNLRPGEYKFTLEEAKKGGKASGKARREKAMLRKIAEEIVNGEFEVKTKEGIETRKGADIIQNGLLQNVSTPKSKNWGKAMELLIKLTDADQPQEEKTFDNSFIEALNDKASEVWKDEE